jgi:hypothetical protein|tara:strand:- start:261 stop:593 length:333 start_codon:yes stop_codon:yes gene_type:complete
MTNNNVQTVEYKSAKGGFISVDDMDEGHMRNAFKKLIVDKLVPEGRVVSNQVDQKGAIKALASLQAAIFDLRKLDMTASEEGVEHWKNVGHYLTDAGLLLSQYSNPEKDV